MSSGSAARAVRRGAAPRVVSSTLLEWRVDLSQAVGSRRATHSHRDSLLLVLRDAEGRIGVGEAAPLPGTSRESIADCQQVLARLIDDLRAAPPDAEGWPELPNLSSLPVACFAFETAFGDLWAQKIRDESGDTQTLSELLGGSSCARDLELNALCASVDEAVAAVGSGFRTLKVKIGGAAFDRDLPLLRDLRRNVPKQTRLRADANGAYALTEARAHLAALAEFDLEYVEQPVAAGSGDLLRLVDSPVPLAADESLSIDDERNALLHTPQVPVWVIKPALFGLRAARRLAVRAQQQGIDVVITHLFDGPVANAAAAELARSLPRNPRACGLARHAVMAAWPDLPLQVAASTGTAPAMAGPAVLVPHGGPGLGIADRAAFVAELARRSSSASASKPAAAAISASTSTAGKGT